MSEEVLTTGEFVKNAKHLYNTALRYAKARIAHARTLKKEDWEDVTRHFRLLHKALTRFNYGYDPLEKGKMK